MKKLILTGTLAIFSCCALIGMAQEGAKPTAGKPTAADTKKADPAAKKGRLPANYGKLGLNDTQKDKIYTIQGTYADQLDELEAQMAAIKSKRDQEIEAVLTDDQKKVLKNLQEAAKEAKEKGKKDDEKSTDGEKKPK